MKPLFQFPRFGLVWISLWSVLLGILGVFLLFNGEGVSVVTVLLGLYLIVGIGIWQEQQWALVMGMLLFGATAVLRGVTTLFAFEWRHLVFTIAFAALAYDAWKGLDNLRRPWAWGDDEDQESDDSDDPSMIAFVLLQRQPKYLEDVVLAKIIESVWGGRYSSGSDPEDDDASDELVGDGFAGAVIGESPLFVVQSEHGVFLIHNHSRPYWEDMDEVVEDIRELRLRNAVEAHTAWLSVDLISTGRDKSDELDPEEMYPLILRLILEIADEDTLAIYRPESGGINVWSDDLQQRLSEPNAYEIFASPDNVPVVPIEGDNPHLIAAVKTAQDRWPEFVAAFDRREDEEKFVVKVKLTVEDNTEFIWLDLIGLEPKYAHGTLANDPVELGDLKLGSQVEVPIEDIQDWCYFCDGDPVGLFSVAAIRKAEAERRQEAAGKENDEMSW